MNKKRPKLLRNENPPATQPKPKIKPVGHQANLHITTISNEVRDDPAQAILDRMIFLDLLACCKEAVQVYEAIDTGLRNRFISSSLIAPQLHGAGDRAKAAIAEAEKQS